MGAAEPDPNGLDHAWFVGDAAKAIKGSPQARSMRSPTGRPAKYFPMVWNQSVKVPGEDVTDRYARRGPIATVRPRLMVEVRRDGHRVEAEVLTLDEATGVCRSIGSSLGPQADLNRHLTCEVTTGASLLIVARHAEGAAIGTANVSGDTVVRLDIDQATPNAARGARPDLRRPVRNRRRQARDGPQATGPSTLERVDARNRLGRLQGVAGSLSRSAANLKPRPS